MYKKGIDAYKEISHTNLSASEHEKAWFESVVMVLNRIKDGSHYNAVEVHVKLIEIADGLGFISENLNPNLHSQHRTLLKNIYSMCIQIINATIASKNLEYLDIVTQSIKTILEKYERPVQ